jgi:hypothetical protein
VAGMKTKLLNHFKALQPALRDVGAAAYLGALDFRLVLRFGNTEVPMYPQFIAFRNGVKQYTPEFGPDVRTFIGWLPYFNKRWDASTEKLKFKELAVQRGLLTPEYSADPAWRASDVLVKKSRSSFGLSIKGPFRHSADHQLDTEAGEYYEKFVRGRIAKVWYWNGLAVCLETEDHAALTGNGTHSIRELAMRRLAQKGRKNRKRLVERCMEYLAYQGLDPDSVPEAGKVVFVDYRYGSVLAQVNSVQDIHLEETPVAGIEAQLKQIGDVLSEAVPAEMRRNCLFTVDAVLDQDNRLWLLEMNSNPFVHPFVYPAIICSLAEKVQHFRAAHLPEDAKVPDTVH